MVGATRRLVTSGRSETPFGSLLHIGNRRSLTAVHANTRERPFANSPVTLPFPTSPADDATACPTSLTHLRSPGPTAVPWAHGPAGVSSPWGRNGGRFGRPGRTSGALG